MEATGVDQMTDNTAYRGMVLQFANFPTLSDVTDLLQHSKPWWSSDKNVAYQYSYGQKDAFRSVDMTSQDNYAVVLTGSYDSKDVLYDWREIPTRAEMYEEWVNSGLMPENPDESRGEELPSDEWVEEWARNHGFDNFEAYLATEQSTLGNYEKEITFRDGASVNIDRVEVYDIEIGNNNTMRSSEAILDFNPNLATQIENWNQKNASVLSPVQYTRDPLIWLEDDSLDPAVKDFILGKLDEALIDVDESYLEYVKRVYIIGSITGRQYDPDSDIDTNVLIDTQAMAMEMGVESEALRKYLKDTLVSHNGESVPQTAHPLNFFLAVDDTMPPADGIYDVLEDVWVKKPEDDYPEDFDPYNAFRDAMERFETIAEKIDVKWGQALRAERAWKTYGESSHKRKMVRCLKALETIHEVLVADRHSIFDMVKKYGADPKEAQLSSSNVCYKAIELNGYLSKLKAAEEFLSQMSEGGEMSLEEMYGTTAKMAATWQYLEDYGFDPEEGDDLENDFDVEYFYRGISIDNLESIKQTGYMESVSRLRNDNDDVDGGFLSCDECDGDGIDEDGDECWFCDGEGVIEQEPDRAQYEELLYFTDSYVGTWGGENSAQIRIPLEVIESVADVYEDQLRPSEWYATADNSFEIPAEYIEVLDGDIWVPVLDG